MSTDTERPILGISGREAADILGIRELSVSRLVMRGVLHKASKGQRFGLDRAEVERVALDRYRPGHPYFLSTTEAAEVLGVTPGRVHQLVQRGFVPAVKHDGRWFLRRHQVRGRGQREGHAQAQGHAGHGHVRHDAVTSRKRIA